MTSKEADSKQSRADKRKGPGVAATAPATATAVITGDADARRLKFSARPGHISRDWLNGYTGRQEAVMPIFLAREELKGWREERARGLWALIEDCFNRWKTECGTPPPLFQDPCGILLGSAGPVDPSKIEPWFCAGPWVSDPVDLLEHLDRTEYQPFMKITSKISMRKLLAVTILHEVSIGDHEDHLPVGINPFAGYSANYHIIAAIKAEKQVHIERLEDVLLEAVSLLMPHVKSANTKKEILASGRKRGAQANKEKAAQRQQALRQAAINFFVNDPQKTVKECAKWIRAEPGLKRFFSYGNGKELSVDRIEDAITGTKDEALVFLAQRPSAQT